MSESPTKPEADPPIGYWLPLAARVLISLIGVPLGVIALNYFSPALASVPMCAALAAYALTVVWWKDTNPDANERYAPRFLIAGSYGVGSLVMGLVSAVWSAAHSDDFRVWVANGIASGRMSFYVSAMLFGFNLFKAAYDQRLSIAGGWQNAIFALALFALGYGYNLDEPVPFLGLLSWSVFFVIGDWALLEQYVIDRKQVLASSHFLRITAVNVLILTSWAVVMVNLWPPVLMTFYWYGVVTQSLMAFILWCGAAGSLADFTAAQQKATDKTAS